MEVAMWLRRLTDALFASRARTPSPSPSEELAYKSVVAVSMRLIAFLASLPSTTLELWFRQICQQSDDLGGVAESLGQISISLEEIQKVMSRQEILALELLRRAARPPSEGGVVRRDHIER
jgi:hypothetical protein